MNLIREKWFIMTWSDVKINVVNILERGKCPHGHKAGEEFIWSKDRWQMCSSACHTLFPYVTGLQSGGSFPWEDEPDSITICCPDYKNPVVFKMTRVQPKE